MYPLVQSQQTIANGTNLAQCLFWMAYKQTTFFYFKWLEGKANEESHFIPRENCMKFKVEHL